ncbi:IclR family transcriptional regulator [Rhizohabitans arisaemae]|uniref:IclR family transcriptional regulator n=1 Tax=Rhizohabitans arisaemae TaxID=2720610 RepID=UPI0024B063F3|nr:IclR family transcriptional regulator [Rhizohabitans arisaemae]
MRRTIDDDKPAAANYHAHALARGLALLERLAKAKQPVTLGELNDDTGLPKSTLVRLLAVLTETGYVVRVDERPSFRLGHKVLELSTAYIATLDASAAASGYLARLAASTGQTANLGVLDGEQVLHLRVEEPDRPIRYTAMSGSRAEAYATGLGKLLLAGLGAGELARHLPAEPYAPKTGNTLTGLARLRADLELTRERGYAFDDNESNVGLRCLAVPLEIDGRWVASVSVSGPSGELDPDRHGDYLAELRATAVEMAADPDLVAALRMVHRSLSPVEGGHS